MDARDAGLAADTRLPDTKPAPIDRASTVDGIDSLGLADVGKIADGRDATADVRDSAVLRGPDGAEVGVPVMDARDAADSRDGRDPADLRDTKPDSTGDGSFDAPADTPFDTSFDTTKDTTKDTAKDTGKPDKPVDSGPHGCGTPIQIPTYSAAQVDLTVSTAGASHLFDLPCGEGGPQVVLSFDVNQHELVYIDTFGATWNTMLALSTTCPIGGAETPAEGMVSCSDDACNTSQSQVVGHLTAGTYYIILGGANGESGEVTLHFQHAQAGNGPLPLLPAGTGTVTGATVDDMGAVDICEGPGNDNSYWWLTCPDYAGGTITASTCTGTIFDSVLILQIPRTNMVTCNDDYEPCGSKSSISSIIPPGAGINVLTIDGGSVRSFGTYQITYTRP